MMPTKTIYVSDDDLPLYERAQELAGGNLSSAVARALQHFVEQESAHQAGFDEIMVQVGPAGSRRQKRFYGVRLIRWQHRLADSHKTEWFSVYRTKGGRFALHRQIQPDWMAYSDPRWWMDVENWKGFNPRRGRGFGPRGGFGEWSRQGEGTLEVYETLGDLEPKVPPELFQQLAHGGDEPPLEDLNI